MTLSTTAHLFIYVDVPIEVRPEVLDLCADVLLHHSDQRDPELFQLGLQRGQLRGLLQRQRKIIPAGIYYPHMMFKCQLKVMRSALSVTSLHRNHPGRRTAMTTAPFVSHRLFALMTLPSADKTRGNRL